jgi:succinate dehydrogenase/fumarate reductase-like Fe-S protein
MINELHVELFRFDSKVDYLPYYKKYTIEYQNGDTILSVLNKINAIDKFGYEPSVEFNLQINGLYLSVKEYIVNIVDRVGSDFKIEPISIYRATNDLLIDKRDYLEKILMFKNFITPMDLDEYAQNFELDYYASNTYNINRDYIGDHALLIANDIIEQNPEHTQEILEMISSKEDGIWYHTSLQNRVFNYDYSKELRIQKLLSMFDKVQTIQGVKASLATEVKNEEKPNVNISQEFSGFNIATYEGVSQKSVESSIKAAKASYVDISMKNEDLAPYSTIVSDDFSLKIAGNILLQAKDENADFIVVRNKSDILLFDNKQKQIEEAVGREIDMPVVSQEQFVKLLEGEKNKQALGFEQHKVNISFL